MESSEETTDFQFPDDLGMADIAGISDPNLQVLLAAFEEQIEDQEDFANASAKISDDAQTAREEASISKMNTTASVQNSEDSRNDIERSEP